MSNPTRPDALSPEKLQLFAASLAGLPQQEIRQAKLLYIRNAIAELKAQEQIFSAFGTMQGCMAVIPIFWPIIAMQKKMLNSQRQLARQKIVNAIDVWKDDLLAAGFDVSRFNLDDQGGFGDG